MHLRCEQHLPSPFRGVIVDRARRYPHTQHLLEARRLCAELEIVVFGGAARPVFVLHGVNHPVGPELHRVGTPVQRQPFLSLRDGPFKQLQGHWHFVALAADACKVELQLEYTFANIVLEHTIGPVFGMIADTMIDRFVSRAETLAAQQNSSKSQHG